MHYVRVYADADGESHFEDVAPELHPESYASSEQLVSAPMPVGDLRFRQVVVDYPPEPHVAPRRLMFITLAGEYEVEVSDGEVRRFGPGSVVLLEDLTGKGHTTRRIGDTVRETIVLPVPED